MDILTHPVAKRRIEWSALLLFVLGLGSMASPHMRLPLHLHHHSGGSSSSSRTSPTHRGSRQSRRSASGGGATSELDRHGSETERASQGVRPRGESSAVMHAASADVAVLCASLLSPPELASPVVFDVHAVRPASVVATMRRGRAPPTV